MSVLRGAGAANWRDARQLSEPGPRRDFPAGLPFTACPVLGVLAAVWVPHPRQGTAIGKPSESGQSGAEQVLDAVARCLARLPSAGAAGLTE